jgi:threonyl-tRNA synthetase
MQEEAPGMVFWHPKGWTSTRLIEQYMRRRAGGNRLSGGAHAAGG